MTTLLVKNMEKKRRRHRKKLTQATKTVQYDKRMAPAHLPDFFLASAAVFMVKDVNFVMLSYDRCYVIFLVF
jgi:hypothetical protein